MKKTDSIPTARAFGVPARMTLDEQCTMERFLGKSRQEAYDMLKTDFCFYEEDLACMGAEAFRFYVLAVQDLADDCMGGDNMDAYSLLEQIVSMLDMYGPQSEEIGQLPGALFEEEEGKAPKPPKPAARGPKGGDPGEGDPPTAVRVKAFFQLAREFGPDSATV